MNATEDMRYCGQWNTPPSRYEGEHGTVELRSKCGYPTRWVVWKLLDDMRFTCDVHLSQAVCAVLDTYSYLHQDVTVAPFDAETMCTCGGPRHRAHCLSAAEVG